MPSALRPRVLKGCQPEKRSPQPGKFGKRRAAVLIAVNLLIVGHIVQWRLTGKTLEPLEFSEATLTLDHGLVTAGFLLMALAVLATVFFGRFFCGWACHILALQDLCAWALGKLGIKPQPIRSRFLFLIPALLLFYMFLWTPLRRLAAAVTGLAGLAPAEPYALRLPLGEGSGAFLTSDFWRNMPGPWIAVLTFAVCGFVIVYLLGSRGFCAYACPYGALFGWMDKLAPGKLLLTGDCTACGKCTAACKSGVNVMQEVRAHGRVVDTACFKDMDCVASCPEQALSFGFGKPAAFSGQKPAAKPFPFSAGEEWALVGVFGATMLVLLGLPEGLAPWAGRLYGVMPLLLSAALAVITAVLAVFLARLFLRPEARFQRWVLKEGRWRPAGKAFAVLALAWLAFLLHSAWVQTHMFSAGWVLRSERLRVASAAALASDAPERLAASRAAENHLRQAQRLALFRDARIPRQRAFLALGRGEWELCEAELRRAVDWQPDQPDSRFQLGWILAGRGKTAEGLRELEQAHTLSPAGGPFRDAVPKAAQVLVRRGLMPEAMVLLEAGLRARPADAALQERGLPLLEQLRAAAPPATDASGAESESGSGPENAGAGP